MWSILIPASDTDALTTKLWEWGTVGIVEEPSGLRGFFEESVDRAVVCSQLGLALANTRSESPFDLHQSPSAECEPVLIGQRFYVAPSPSTTIPPTGRIALTINNSIAFGSGRHETTQLCVEAMEKHLKPGSVVADIGCGSGILSAVAKALGAATIVSCDIHHDATISAQTLIDNPVFVGSADGLRSEFADLVLANLTGKVLDLVAHDLRRITKPNGLLIIAGFLRNNGPARFRPLEASQKEDWECWLCRPQDIHAPESAGEPAAHSQQWWL